MSAFIKKITSRKFILALVGVAIGLATVFGVDGSVVVELTGLIGGLVTAATAVTSYIKNEAKVDAAAVFNNEGY